MSANDMVVFSLSFRLIFIISMFVTSFATAVTNRMNYMLGNGATRLAEYVTF